MRPRDQIAVFAASCLLIVALFAAHSSYFMSYINDDAFITFRYARNLAVGIGPYFNAGERVEGYTSPLMTVLMSAAHRLGGHAAVPGVAKGLGWGSAALSLVLVLALTRVIGERAGMSAPQTTLWGITAAGLMAASVGFTVNSVSGLETLLFTCLVTGGLLAGVQFLLGLRSWPVAASLFAAAYLTRPEGGALFAAFWTAALVYVAFDVGSGAERDDRNPPSSKPWWTSRAVCRILKMGALVAVVVLGHLILRLLLYDGEWLPNTFYAKTGGYWEASAGSYVWSGLSAAFLGLGGIAAAAIGLVVPGLRRREVAVVGAVAIAGACLPFALGVDWMIGWRFLVPVLPLLSILITFGWYRLIVWLSRRRLVVTAVILLSCLLGSWVYQASERTEVKHYVQTRASGYEDGHLALAEWLCEGLALPGDRIALMDIGIIGYVCQEQSILDVTGLTDRHIAKSSGGFLKKEYDPQYVLGQEPEFIVLTFGAPLGEGSESLSRGGRWVHWTLAEERLMTAPEFHRFYVSRGAASTSGAEDRLEALAAMSGALRVFQHHHPNLEYYLAVYERIEPRPLELEDSSRLDEPGI